MGAKRPLQEEVFPELSFKQPKQLDCDTSLSLKTEESLFHGPTHTFPSSGSAKRNCCQPEFDGKLEIGDTAASTADKELEASAPMSLITSSGEEDAGNNSSLEQFEYSYMSLFNSSPRKKVPIGPDHQAEIPCWNPKSSGKDSAGPSSSVVDTDTEQHFMGTCIMPMPDTSRKDSAGPSSSANNDREQKFVGTCIMPMSDENTPTADDHQAEIPCWNPNTSGKDFAGPSSSADNSNNRERKFMGTCIMPMPNERTPAVDKSSFGCSRRDCGCLDAGSLRCVQQHVKEAREKLRETLGEEKFAELGFLDMGEDVARDWTPDEEQVFRDVVFANPASHGKNFWTELSVAFPTRTRKEIVSYYFNVFMLRRRAVQNRSYLLEIDSDNDDDWRGGQGRFCQNEFSDPDSNGEEDDSNELQGGYGELYLVDEEEEDGGSTVEYSGDRNLDDCWSEHERLSGDEASEGNLGISGSNLEEGDGAESDGGSDQTSGPGEEKGE